MNSRPGTIQVASLEVRMDVIILQVCQGLLMCLPLQVLPAFLSHNHKPPSPASNHRQHRTTTVILRTNWSYDFKYDYIHKKNMWYTHIIMYILYICIYIYTYIHRVALYNIMLIIINHKPTFFLAGVEPGRFFFAWEKSDAAPPQRLGFAPPAG